MFRRVGELIGADESAERLVRAIRRDGLGDQTPAGCRRCLVAPRRRSRVFSCWSGSTRPFCSGHWNPEIVEQAGGVEVLGKAGTKSRRVTWDEVASSRPDVIIVSPCGFALDRSAAELGAMCEHPEWRDLTAVRSGRVAVVDGSAYFSRPGPRLEDSLRIAAAVIDPRSCAELAPAGELRWPAAAAKCRRARSDREMGYVSHLSCSVCRAEYPADRVMNLCERDNRPVQMILDLERLETETGRDGWWNPVRRDLWRFGGLLPLDVNDPAGRRHIVSRGEGCTPCRARTTIRWRKSWDAGSRSRTRASTTRASARIPRCRSRIGGWR